MKRIAIFFTLSLFIGGCGFHLRGLTNKPNWLHSIALVSANNDRQLLAMIKSLLHSSNIRVDSNAKYRLIINTINLQQQIISVGASTNPRQYALILLVEFQLQTNKGRMIKGNRTIQIYRQLTINNDRILGSTDEESILVNEMKQDAAIQIINQISTP